VPIRRLTITVSEMVHVRRPPEAVFDFTQDYATRSAWDPAIREARVLREDPRTVRVDVKGVGSYSIVYRLFRRPERTSASFEEVRSWWLEGGGGSWQYIPRDGGTDWTQTNTLELRHPRLLRLLEPLVRRQLRDGMRAGMARAKAILEARATG
jgi:hypothetical protein